MSFKDEQPSTIRKITKVLDFIGNILAHVTNNLHMIIIAVGGMFLAIILAVYALQAFH